jgi:GH15 family glucan-1,4-alpha-glucosidase
MTSLDLAVIGNCGFGALIDRGGRICWACLPHFDGDPVFCSLLRPDSESDSGGFFDVEIERFARSEQEYVENTAVLTTRLFDEDDRAVEIVDFAPRFKHLGRSFRPTALVRSVRPLGGAPRIRVRLRPSHDYGAGPCRRTRGSNHVRYVAPDWALRLTTNAPVSFVEEERMFQLEDPLDFFLGPDESLTRSVEEVSRDFRERTTEYWLEFSRHLAVPFEWQDAVIRAAITLKLSSFEETGAIVAAMTTSLPEAADSGRNWDYRFCWMRDAFFVVQALNRLGVTDAMEGYLGYLLNVMADVDDGYLQPVYGIRLQRNLAEREVEHLSGYRGMGPVRVGNQAHEQVQNDSYGGAILAAAQSFFDRRLPHRGTLETFRVLEPLGEQARRRFDQPDAGLWEFRANSHVHTYSSVMCWVACDRLARIAEHLDLADRAAHWRDHATTMREVILERAWSPRLERFVSTFDGEGHDASLLLLHELGFVERDDPRFRSTVASIEKELRRGRYIIRYEEDEIGPSQNAFLVCTFWYIDALHALGREEEARELFEEMLQLRNHVGLLSEDVDPDTGELWGNFPQTYSLVGLILSALRLSAPWDGAF